MNDTVATMKRVNAILLACRDDARLRKRVADETSKWVRTKDTNVERDFESFLHRLEEKFGLSKPNLPLKGRRRKGPT